MPNLVAYNSGNTISNSIQFGTIVMDVNGDVNQGSLNWCPDFGICNQYLIVTDTYTNGETNQLNARPMGFQTSGLTDLALIDGINKLAASKSEGPFGTLSDAMNWAIYEGYFVTNQEYPTIVTSGCVLNLDSNFPPSYPLVFDTWYDLTGNNNTGLLNNGITYNSSLRGSLLLNGTDQYVSFSATTDIPVGNSNYTISVWFNPSTTSGDRGLVGWGNFGTTNQVNALKITSSGLVNYWWANDLQANYSFTIGDWYNAVATFDGTTRSLWINGSLISSDTPVGHNVPYSTNLEIGVTNGIEFFGGNMGEVQIFNRALSSTEVYDNYNALYPRYNGTYTDPCSIAPQCTRTPTNTPTSTPVYYYYLVYDVDINCTAYDGVVYRSATDYSATILSGQYLYVNGNFLSLKYIETTYAQAYVNTLNSILITSCVIPSSTPTQTPTNTATPTPVYYYYLVYDVDINCTAYNGVVYRTTTDYSSSILTGQYTFVNGDTGTLKYVETTYPQAFVNTLNSIIITTCIIPSPTQTMTPSHTATPTPVYYYYLVYDVNINCNAYDGVVYRTTTDYSGSILTGQYAYINGNFATLKYIETTYVQAFVDTLNSIVITSCILPSPTQTVTPTNTATPPSTPTLTQTPFPVFLLNSTAGLVNGGAACNDYNINNRANFYSSTANGGTITTGTFLYTNINQIGNPAYYIPDGYYSNGTTYWFFQNGTTSDVGTACPAPSQTPTETPPSTPPSTPTLTQTPFPSFILNSTAGLSNGGAACNDYNINNRVAFYSSTANGGTIHSGTYLYTSIGGIGNSAYWIPDGYYSNGTTFWLFQNGTTGDAGTTCPAPTPTATLPQIIANGTYVCATGTDCDGEYNISSISGGAGGPYQTQLDSGGWNDYPAVSSYTSLCGGQTYIFSVRDGQGNTRVSDPFVFCMKPTPTPTMTPTSTPASYFYNAFVSTYDSGTQTCTSTGTEAVIYSGPTELSNGSWYTTDGVIIYQPYGPTSNPGSYIDVRSYLYTQSSTCVGAAQNY